MIRLFDNQICMLQICCEELRSDRKIARKAEKRFNFARLTIFTSHLAVHCYEYALCSCINALFPSPNQHLRVLQDLRGLYPIPDIQKS
jgi:hypothetical protein